MAIWGIADPHSLVTSVAADLHPNITNKKVLQESKQKKGGTLLEKKQMCFSYLALTELVT